jgi:hypothetical protein
VITESDRKTAEGRSSSYQETVAASLSREDDDEDEEEEVAEATAKLKAVTKVRFSALAL